MKPSEHLAEFERTIVQSRLVKRFTIGERREKRFEAYIKVRLFLVDDSVLDVSEYIHATEEDSAEIMRYSYHGMDSSNRLRLRWDNVRHYPDLPHFPHHVHDGDDKNVLPGAPMNLLKVLDIIADELKKTTGGRPHAAS